ncbi:MAG: GNAT family N-acetyltransferase [Bacteroidales bacterium]|nr:GNAT family N-acetyltransferase [Bacteroidales bacterium]
MKLTNKNIKLRAPEINDVEVLYKWENDESIWYLSQTNTPFSHFDLEQFVLNSNHDIYTEKQYRFMIEDIQANSIVGCIDLFEFDAKNNKVGIGILIDEKYRAQGFASKALDIVINYAFEQLNVHQLYCNILSSNTESLNLFKRKHFSVIGVKEDWVYLDNQYQDEVILQLIR